jgi:hypothetical protein
MIGWVLPVITAIFIEKVCPRMRSDEKSPKRNGVSQRKTDDSF